MTGARGFLQVSHSKRNGDSSQGSVNEGCYSDLPERQGLSEEYFIFTVLSNSPRLHY